MKSFKSILFCQTLLPFGLQLLTLHIHPSHISPSLGTPDAEGALFYQVSCPVPANRAGRSRRDPQGANAACTTSASERLRLQSARGSEGQPACREKVCECVGVSSSSQLHTHHGKCFEGSVKLCTHTHTVLCFPLASFHLIGMPHGEMLSPSWSPGLGTGHTGTFQFFELNLQRPLHRNIKDSVPVGASFPTQVPKSPPALQVPQYQVHPKASFLSDG